MNYLLWQWRRFRLSFMMRGLSLEERKDIINQAKLEAALDKYSRTLRSVR